MLNALLALAILPQGPLAPGISAELAEQRRQRISEVRYFLEFELDPGMREVTGTVRAQFTLIEEEQPTDPVILDFAGTGLSELTVNEIDQGNYAVLDNHVLLPADALNPLVNAYEAEFTSPVASTGTPLTIYRDRADGHEYYYTLLVPADAHKLFPCFDQPDLKAIVTLSLIVPNDWKVVGNADVDVEQSESLGGGRHHYLFEETDPLSTYLIAFAAGPFAVLDQPSFGGFGADPRRRARLYYRESRSQDLEASVIMARHREGLRWLESYFGVPYPFAKLDLVLLPGFPYGGMEHAGAIFYRESGLIFDHPPTESEEIRRSTLIYHELSHQWFGNLVTMEWFDDLWLKEGFATFLAYNCLDALEPDRNSWLRFSQRIVQTAYEVDSTAGTTPVYQELGNLADAKSAYGPIVYNKAPAVLRELHERLGARAFQSGLRRFLNEHAYENATWGELITPLAQAGRTDLRRWSDRWILSAGMPEVRAAWEVDSDGLIDRFVIRQRDIQGEGRTWPLRLKVLLIDGDGGRRTISVRADRAETEVRQLQGQPPPASVVLNPDGVAYGRFLLDQQSREYLLESLGAEEDLLARNAALTGLHEAVRDAELDPRRFAVLLIELLETERDSETQQQIFGMLSTSLFRYLAPESRGPLVGRVTELLLGQLQEGAPGLELQNFRFLARYGEGEGVLDLCRQVAAGQTSYPGLAAGKRDRFLAAAALLGRGHGPEALARLESDLAGQDIAREIYESRAANPAAAEKERYFLSYLRPDDPPEQWMQGSLSFFHWPGHEELALPYLQKALDQLEWVKTNRRIFFMPAWIDSFVNGHSSDEALAIVEDLLEDRNLAPDIELKLLQSIDGLRRAVNVRNRWQ